LEFSSEARQGRKIKEGTRRIYVGLDKYQAERPVKHAQGKTALDSRDLILVKLHRVDGATSVFVILSKRAEYTG
jgi:hypothetical protein